MLPDLERRSVVELHTDQSKIIGHALIFDTRSQDLGGFCEIVRPSAVDRSLTADVRALYNHDAGAILGRTPKTLTLRKDTRGLAFELDVAPTQAGRDAFELVRRGDVTGASFGFTTKKDAWRLEAGVRIRELLDIEIAEISLTPFPCYPTDVSIAHRSLEACRTWLTVNRAGTNVIAWLKLQAKVR